MKVGDVVMYKPSDTDLVWIGYVTEVNDGYVDLIEMVIDQKPYGQESPRLWSVATRGGREISELVVLTPTSESAEVIS